MKNYKKKTVEPKQVTLEEGVKGGAVASALPDQARREPRPTMDAAGVPGSMEYAVAGEAWNCERLDLLAVEFFSRLPAAELRVESGGVESKNGKDLARASGSHLSTLNPQLQQWLALFHQMAALKPRSWMITRRLFGLMPVNAGMGADPEDLRVWERGELSAKLGLTKAQLQAELDAVRGAWIAVEPRPELRVESRGVESKEDLFEEDPILKRFGFEIKWDGVGEMTWFVERVKSFERVLKETFSAGLGWNILNAELQIRRLTRRLNSFGSTVVGGTDYAKVQKQIEALAKMYQDQIDKLEEVCPWAKGVANRSNFSGQMSEFTRCHQEYYGNGDNRLVDGVFTATEWQVQMRRSAQAPDPRYRLGLVMHINAARAGLWDPNWKPPFENAVLKKLDRAFAEAAKQIGDESGEVLIDLESEAAADEYPDLVLPSELAAPTN